MLRAPTRTAPAASSRLMIVASRFAGGASRLILAPASVVRPAISNRFFTANGTPARGGSASRRARASSSALLGHHGEGVELRAALTDAGERCRDDALRGASSGGDGGGD